MPITLPTQKNFNKALSTYRRTWKVDLIAALSVAVVAIPQALAYAGLAGLPPYVGLTAASIPTIIAALFGTSKILAAFANPRTLFNSNCLSIDATPKAI